MSILIVVAVQFLAVAPPAEASQVKVIEPNAFVYETPDTESGIIRKLYLGELVTVAANVKTPNEIGWLRVELGEEQTGYVRREKVGAPAALATNKWRPTYIVRDERPFLLGARIAGETLGAGVNFRYQPFTRLGASFSVGTLIDPPTQKGAMGPTFAFGLYSAFLLSNFSPIIELGISHSTYAVRDASLALLNLYASAGVEYMFDNGFFVHAYLVYVRSIDISVNVPLSAFQGQPMLRPSFGWLDSYAQINTAFNFFFPGLTIGYAF